MKPECTPYRDLFSAYVEGELSDERRLALDAHLRDCAACRREVDELRVIMRDVAELPVLAAPKGFRPRVVAAIHKQQGRRRVIPLWTRALPVAAMFLIVIGLTLMAGRGGMFGSRDASYRVASGRSAGSGRSDVARQEGTEGGPGAPTAAAHREGLRRNMESKIPVTAVDENDVTRTAVAAGVAEERRSASRAAADGASPTNDAASRRWLDEAENSEAPGADGLGTPRGQMAEGAPPPLGSQADGQAGGAAPLPIQQTLVIEADGADALLKAAAVAATNLGGSARPELKGTPAEDDTGAAPALRVVVPREGYAAFLRDVVAAAPADSRVRAENPADTADGLLLAAPARIERLRKAAFGAGGNAADAEERGRPDMVLTMRTGADRHEAATGRGPNPEAAGDGAVTGAEQVGGAGKVNGNEGAVPPRAAGAGGLDAGPRQWVTLLIRVVPPADAP